MGDQRCPQNPHALAFVLRHGSCHHVRHGNPGDTRAHFSQRDSMLNDIVGGDAKFCTAPSQMVCGGAKQSADFVPIPSVNGLDVVCERLGVKGHPKMADFRTTLCRAASQILEKQCRALWAYPDNSDVLVQS